MYLVFKLNELSTEVSQLGVSMVLCLSHEQHLHLLGGICEKISHASTLLLELMHPLALEEDGVDEQHACVLVERA